MSEEIQNKKLIQAIQEGLRNAKLDMTSKGTITNNRIPTAKWDYIHTSINKYFNNEDYDVIPLNRGIFTLILIFEKSTNNLYTLMRKDNFYNKLKMKNKKKNINYFEALCDYNYLFQKLPNQVMLSYEENTELEKQKKELQEKIQALLNEKNINSYKTFIIDINKFNLVDISVVMCSKWLDIISEEKLGQYINPSYDEDYAGLNRHNIIENNIKEKIVIKTMIKKEEKNG